MIRTQLFDYFAQALSQDLRVIVGVSGGPDSMVLVDTLFAFYQQRGRDFSQCLLVHCDHAQREESAGDIHVLAHYKTFFPSVIHRYEGESSTESSLRTRRYSCFLQEFARHRAQVLMLGHNLSDRVETTLLNCLRGAHIEGFLNMRQDELVHGMRVIRPLLHISKGAILQYADVQGVPYVIDLSNSDPSISQRNAVRGFLQQMIGQFDRSESSSPKFFDSFDAIYSLIDSTNQNNQIQLIPIVLHPARKLRHGYRVKGCQSVSTCVELFKKLDIYTDISQSLLEEFWRFFVGSNSGTKQLHGRLFVKSHGQIYAFSTTKQFWSNSVEHVQGITRVGSEVFDAIAYEVKTDRFIGKKLRYPRSSDRFKGKSYAKYCINQKIPIFRRFRLPVIVDEHDVIVQIVTQLMEEGNFTL